MRFACILIVQIASAVRSAVDLEQTSLEDEVCVLKTCTAASAGHYEVHGTKAQQLSGQLRPQQQYFVAISCDEPIQPDASASVVQWLDAKDPVNNSSIHIYMNPLMKTMLQGEPAKLCAKEAGNWQCLCKLQHNTEFGAFKWLAPAMPSAVSQKWLAMHLKCPSRMMDLFTAAVLVLLLPVAIVSPYAAWKAWRPTFEPLASPPKIEFKSIEVKNPMQNFVEGFSWSAGFLLSLAALQMGTLLFVRKSSDEEAFVWFIAAFPAILAMAGAVRLGNVICKMQLAHACLGQGCLLTEPMNSSYLDLALLTMLISYLLAVLWSVSSSIMNIILALVALAGSTWALLKAIQTIRALEKKLKTLEVNADFVSEVPSLKLIAWKALISAGRRNDDIHDLLSKTAKESETEGHGLGSFMEDVKDMNIRDTFWHGRTIFHLTGSRAGFLVLPSFVAMVMASLIITASQVTVYACSRGQLSNLQLASSPSLEFHPWQTRYEVLVDTSFRQVTMVASSDPSTTQWINYTQPNTSTPMQIQMTDNSSGSMVAEIHLSPRHVPRISHIYVKGLRVSLDPVEYQVRFSPLMTLPTTVKITAQDFETKLAWSALPGSIISVPAGSDDFMIEVTLTDFVFNFPRKAEEYEDQRQELWTTFEESNSINETTCRSKCHNKLHCFNYFVSDAGCFFIEGNRTQLESHVSNISSISWSSRSSSLYSSRQISGEFVGCRQTSETSGRCPNGKDLNGLLRFEGISPDWRGSLANLGFTLNLDVGGQHFGSDSQLIQLRRGIPFANDVIGCLLAEDNDHRIKIIETNLWIDSGNVVVNVSKFDPENITALKLSVMPLLPDPAFVVQWEVNTTLEMPTNFAIYTKCNESPLLSERYTLCGAKPGIGIDGKPITITVDPWSGRPESLLRFTVVPKSLEVKDEKAPLAEHMVRMNFKVDSPAAWAAEYHNCTLLNRNVSVEKSLLESADATCQLLRSCSEETLAKLCELITQNGLGGRGVHVGYGEFKHVPALLPPQGVLKALACLKDVGHDACTMPTAWHHDSTGLHLQGHGAKVPVKFVVAQLEEMDETKGSAWLHAMNVTSESQCAEWKDDPALFDRELAKTALEVGQITALTKVLRILGHWKPGMPQILLDALVASHRLELMQLMEVTPQHSLSDTFSGVKALTAALDDASDLCFTSLALNLAENLEHLRVNCFRCNDFAKIPSAKAWIQLSSQVAKAKIQHLTLDHFIVTDVGIIVHQAKSLKSLMLQHNQISTLSKEAFSGLSNLKAVYLMANKLTELPTEVFSGIPNLEYLDLRGNHLKEDDIRGLLSNLTARGVEVNF